MPIAINPKGCQRGQGAGRLRGRRPAISREARSCRRGEFGSASEPSQTATLTCRASSERADPPDPPKRKPYAETRSSGRRWPVAVAGLALLGLAGQASAQSCDRACLIGITDRYLAAVVAHDPSKAPLAPGVVFVENLKRERPGEGLWKTATGGPAAFRIYVPDVTLQQVGWIGGDPGRGQADDAGPAAQGRERPDHRGRAPALRPRRRPRRGQRGHAPAGAAARDPARRAPAARQADGHRRDLL